MEGDLKREVTAGRALGVGEVNVGPHRDFAVKSGERAHFCDDVVGREAVALWVEGIVARVVRLDHMRTEPAKAGDIIIVDGKEPDGVGVAGEELRARGHHREGSPAAAGLAEDRSAKQIVAEAERAEEEGARGHAPTEDVASEAQGANDTRTVQQC